MAKQLARGFTLIEAIAVILILGIILAGVAVFMQKPVQGYVSATARARLADTADTALRRIGRDIRLALPNSVRVDASGLFVEFIPIKTGGRYVQNDACFSTGCTSVTTQGDILTNVTITTGSDLVAIYNQYNNSGNDCSAATGIYSAYCGHGLAVLTAATGAGTTSDTLSFANTIFVPPGGSPTRRVFIVAASPVTYACDAGAGTLWRISGYARQASQPVSLASGVLSGASSKVPLATNVTCPVIVAGTTPPRFSYAGGAAERNSLLSAWITLSSQGETVSLLHQIHVDNTP